MANTKQATKAAAAKRAAASKTKQEVLTGEVLAGDDLPIVTVKGKARPQARLQLGEGGKVYLVTKPKDLYYQNLNTRLGGLAALAHTPPPLNPDGTASADTEALEKHKALVEDAMQTLRDFVTCAFYPDDHEEVLEHLASNTTNEEVEDIADAMKQLMEIWRRQAPATEA